MCGRALGRAARPKFLGPEAVRVYADGQRMLKRLIEGRWLTANGVIESRYFNFSVGRIGDDQLKDQAARRHMNEQALQRLLAPNL